jgi:hypothetical protein
MLVDLDWASKVGEARYPPKINTSIRWADGVNAGALIMKSHDLEMLEML